MLTRDTLLACATAPKRNSKHWKNETVTWGSILDWMATPDNHKECGNYILGTLRPTPQQHNPEDPLCTRLHRNKAAIVTRAALTLDLDFAPEDGTLPTTLDLVLPFAALLHTTFSSTEEKPRYRMIVPLDREVAPDEYVVAARYVMQIVGEGYFDPGSDQPERYMFKPAATSPEDFGWWVVGGGLAEADALLDAFEPDLSSKPAPRANRSKRDPFSLEGHIGAFNRAYQDWQLLITEYDLPYVPAGEDRWRYATAKSMAGMGPVQGQPGLVFSHHAVDPAYGQACSAFDLVRLHYFATADEGMKPGTPVNRTPSHLAMLDLAARDPRVLAEEVGVDFSEEMEDIAESQQWRLQLTRNRKGTQILDSVHNWDLIRKHDEVCQVVFFNEMTDTVEVLEDLPWRRIDTGLGNTWTEDDDDQMALHVERTYGLRPTVKIVTTVVRGAARAKHKHPVQEWLNTLEWDGVARLETALPCQPTPYTRMVARKCLVAAVARVYEPGCKWDHSMILHGTEGLGKTRWIELMGNGWAAPISGGKGGSADKDVMMILRRSWIVTSDEGGHLRRSDAEAMKEFLTRTEDVYRAPYERAVRAHPRRCVVWGTTNDDVFLRNQEGNRRFLMIRVDRRVNFEDMTQNYVEQVWAEAVHMYRQGEQLWLDAEESVLAAEARESFTEEANPIQGIIQNYLDMPLPMDWATRSIEQRQEWLRDRAGGFVPEGDLPTDATCSMQMWVEALGNEVGRHRQADVNDINRALRALGWVPGRIQTFPCYGPQQAFYRPEEPEIRLEDLL